MVLFKSLRRTYHLHTIMYLHSTMVLFKCRGFVHCTAPLVFTFHYGPIQIRKLRKVSPSIVRFTFHYGPIQILSVILSSLSNNSFTFHYGPIQIEYFFEYLILDKDLHSTMVLFKLAPCFACSCQRKNLHSTMVLFK